MTIPLDTYGVINSIRSQYLTTYDDDQSHRIIRPYTAHEPQYEGDDNKVFGELLSRLESPPIPINVLDDDIFGWNMSANEQSRSNNLGNGSIEEKDEDDDDLFKSKYQSSVLNHDPVVKDEEPSPTHKLASLNSSSTGSVSTIKFDHNHENRSDTKKHGSKYVPSFSKLFKNTSHTQASRNQVRSNSKVDEHSDDDDDDYDDDDDDDDDDEYKYEGTDLTTAAQSENDLSSQLDDDDDDDDFADDSIRINESDIDINGESVLSPSLNTDQSGILIDQNYSDVNAASQFDNDKYMYNVNVGSSDDDDLLLDSDYSDDDEVVLNDTFNSSGLQSLTGTSSKSGKDLSSIRSLSTSHRRFSLDISKSRPKVRPHRADSLNPKLVANTIPDNTFEIRTEKSPAIVEELNSLTKNNSMFEKVEIKPHDLSMSKLSTLLNKTLNISKEDPLEQFIYVSGEDVNSKKDAINLTVYLPNEKQIQVKIRKSAIVFDTIGFILYKLNPKYPELLNTESDKNINSWCLKLIDDDGEPYEGSFGLMDRTKPISSYGEDEVALIKVSEAEFKQNESITPMPQVSEPESVGKQSTSKAIFQKSYYKSIIPVIDNDIKDAKTVKIQVYDYPAHSKEDSYVSLDFLITDNVNEILLKYAKWAGIDPNMYVLKAVGEHFVLNLNDQISSLDENYKLEVLDKGQARMLQLGKRNLSIANSLPTINSNLTPQALAEGVLADSKAEKVPQVKVQQSVTSSSTKGPSSLSKQGLATSFKPRHFLKASPNKPESSSQVPHSALAGQYDRYTVWRRLPMSFINRHEREFSIDGDYVYIMPKDEKIWYDTNFKTTTFHISNIKSCKVSRKVPSNFKIVIDKPRGPKRYDFEAINSTEANQIINKLKTLMEAHKINNSASH